MASSKDSKTKSTKGMKDDSPKKVIATRKPVAKKTTKTKTDKAPAKSAKSVKITNVKTAKQKGNAMPDHSETPPAAANKPFNAASAAAPASPEGNHSGYKPSDDETYMGKNQITHFRVMLERMRQQLMEDVDRTVNDMRNSDKNLSDYTDCATNEEEMFVMLRTSTREGKLLKKIEEALQRIEHHDYGFCDGCGIEIGFRRLEARPTATLCIDCKTLAEIREKQRNG